MMLLLMLSASVLMVCSVHSVKPPSTMEETVKRLEADMKSYKAEMAGMKSTIHQLQKKLDKCSCGQDVDSDLKSVIKKHREERQVSSALLTDALSAFMNHFQHQEIEVPGVSKSAHNGSSSSFPSGSVYTRWGRTTCDGDADLIYRGFTAGANYGLNTGGGANHLCLPSEKPEYNKYNEAAVYTAQIHGAEYESNYVDIFPKNDAQNKNVPCARCYSQRSAKMMLPARRTCPTGWTREYEGYLMTNDDDGSQGRSMYECIDSEPEYIRGLPGNTNGAMFYFVVPDCEGAGTTGHCPPYHPNQQLTCVLCTK